MKLAIVRQRYTPYGGAERFIERALSALVAQGTEVTLLTRSWAGAPQSGFRQIVCDPPYSRLFGGRAARDRSFAQAVQVHMASGQFDLVQSHERIAGCDIFRAGDGVHAAWLQHRKRMVPGWQVWAQQLSPFHRAVLRAERAMLTHPALKAVICNSRMVAEEVSAHYGLPPAMLPVIYNGVDTEAFHPGLAETLRVPQRKQWGLTDEPVLLYVGSGFARKGVVPLLHAFARCAERSARLVIVGADRKLAAMQALAVRLGIGERVLFAGPVQDVKPFYAAADAFVLPSFYDPCPNAALEALACGLPTLTSMTCGAQEWITPGENGVLVRVGLDAASIDALADGLAQLLTLAGSSVAHLAARQRVAGLTLEAMAGELLALYQRLLEPGRV